MKRSISIIIMIIICMGLFTVNGCSPISNPVNVVGSTSMQPVVEALAEKFEKENKAITIDVDGGGSSAGIKAVLNGITEIGSSSRPLTAEEKKAGLKAVNIAWDGIVIVINHKNKIKHLTVEQVRWIFSGKITNWAEVGGDKRPIMVVNREEGSGTRKVFTELVMGREPIILNAILEASTGAERQAVSGNPDAIGYISLTSMDTSVKNVDINGVTCTIANIKDGKYPIIRPFLFVTKGKESDAVRKFIDYVLKDGQKIIAANDLFSIK